MNKEYVYVVWGDGYDYIVVDTVFSKEDVAQRRADELNTVETSALRWWVKKLSIHSNLHGLVHPDDTEHEEWNDWFINT